jgi:hypothetical protein
MKTQPKSKTSLWAGWIICVLCILFLLLDAVMKVIKAAPSMEGSSKLGVPLDAVQGIGIILLICTIIYAIPRTAILGAVLITGYLGGAVSVMVCAKAPFYFPLIFGVLVWLGVYLRDEKLKALL